MKNKNILQKKKGFVALLSAIIIAALLVGLSLTVSNSEFAAESSVLDSELKKTSAYLADSCADSALYNISHEYTYTVPVHGQDITVASNTCSIVSIMYGTENTSTHSKLATIQVSATYRTVQTRETIIAQIHNPSYSKALLTDRDITIVSWTELP
jgi:hypothetical protein